MSVAVLRIDRVHAAGGDVAGESDIYVTLRQENGPYFRTATVLDRDTIHVTGDFLFRDRDKPVMVAVWDADFISSDDCLARYHISLVPGTYREHGMTYTVEFADLVPADRHGHLCRVERLATALAASVSGDDFGLDVITNKKE